MFGEGAASVKNLAFLVKAAYQFSTLGAIGAGHARLYTEVGVILTLRVVGTGDEFAETPHFYNQRLAAIGAVFAGRLVGYLDLFYLLDSLFQVFLQRLVEPAHHAYPLQLVRGYLVQFVFHLGGVFHVDDVAEVFHQHVSDYESQFRRLEASAGLADVFPALNSGHDGGIGGWPADAVLLQHLDERGLCEARRRFGELLFRLNRRQ